MPVPPEPARPPLTTAERAALAAMFLLFAAWGVVVEVRGAGGEHRWTDFAVFARAAWAARAGADLYAVTDEKQLHYHYPPLLALLLAPLADPPPGRPAAGFVPFAAAVAVWYAVSVACLFAGVHRLATALEAVQQENGGPPTPGGGRAWWQLRFAPVAACLGPIGAGLSLGQVTPLLFLLIAGFIAAVARRRRAESGLWLAGAICLKLIPAYLLLYPLWRRDRRCLAGTAVGLVVGLVLIPAAVLGPGPAATAYGHWAHALVLPGLGLADPGDRGAELLDATATMSQCPLVVFHKARYWGRGDAPAKPDADLRLTHWGIGAALTVLTLAVGRGRAARRGPRDVLVLGMLVVVMLLLSPVCHGHYLALSLPLVMVLFFEARRAGAVRPAVCFLAAYLAVGIAFFLPGLEAAGHLGLLMYAQFALWLSGAAVLRVASRYSTAGREASAVAPRAAA